MKRIIIVDDDEVVLQLMQDILELEGYSVQTCSNGTELQQLLSDPPDLIILNVFLKREDGRKLCRHLKQDERTRHIPVILYSAYLRAQEAIRESHADDFLEKPFHLHDLMLKIVQYLSVIIS